MKNLTPAEISRAYNNRLLVPHFQDILRQWDEKSKAARAQLRGAHWDLAYGEAPLNRLDVIEPAPRPEQGKRSRSGKHVSAGAPILFFIHGGYWRMLDKSAQTFIAPHWSRRGAMVVIPNYSLAPTVTLEQISVEIAQALAWTWRNARRFGGDPSRIVVAGHSAGGHLTGMALSCRWPALAPDLPAHMVTRGLAISGLFDLGPLVHCEWLMPDIRLTPLSISRLSPAGWKAPAQRRLVAVAGDLESSEFHRQNELISGTWGAKAVPLIERIAGRNHFDILLDLEEPDSRLSVLLADLLEVS